MRVEHFKCRQHPLHPRLDLIQVEEEAVRSFLDSTRAVIAEAHDLAGPRFSGQMLALHGDLITRIRQCVSSRARGGVVLEMPSTSAIDSRLQTRWYMGLAGALGEILPEDQATDGRAMPAQWFVTISLSFSDSMNPKLLHFSDPRLPWPLHSDRALKSDPGDFLLVVKSEERHGKEGRIRLLHLDDFSRLDEFLSHPLAFEPLTWKSAYQLAPPTAQAALRRQPGVKAPIFEHARGRPTIRFTDHRFRRPSSLEQMKYIESLEAALREEAECIPAFHLPQGAAYVVNNRFMLHGREGFDPEPAFHRSLLRFCGRWGPDHDEHTF